MEITLKYNGLRYEIPNEYGNYLVEILKPLNCKDYIWNIFSTEIHIIDDEDNFTDESLINESIVQGENLYNLVVSSRYYLIFATLMAFENINDIVKIRTYDDFIKSNCKTAISIADCSFVMIWSKDEDKIANAYKYATIRGYNKIKYMTDDFINSNCHME